MPVMDRHQAIVHAVKTDKAKAGRIEVKLSTVDGQVYPHKLEPVFLPGWFSPPKPGDTVEVELPDGEDIVENPDEARYLGVRLDDKNKPPDEFQVNYPDRRGYKTPGGHLLIFDDKTSDIFLTSTGQAKVEATVSASIVAPAVNLGTAAPVDAVIKGTAFMTSFQVFTLAMYAANTVWLAGAQALPDLVVWVTAVSAAGAALHLAGQPVTNWLSTIVKTG